MGQKETSKKKKENSYSSFFIRSELFVCVCVCIYVCVCDGISDKGETKKREEKGKKQMKVFDKEVCVA